ncbi:hypothetical protein COCNU_scaffold175054G000010 [Cocos nucifera]|nr:hypothetical protein [Cocos nucifera]
MAAACPLHDRVAIVTGASRGIGRAIAIHLASLGARLVLNYASSSSSPHADLLATELNSSSSSSAPRAVAVQADVSDPANVKSLFDRAESFFGTAPHILVASLQPFFLNKKGYFQNTTPQRMLDWSINLGKKQGFGYHFEGA